MNLGADHRCQLVRAVQRELVSLEAVPVGLQFLDQRNKRLVVGPIDRHDLRVGTTELRIPDVPGCRRVAEVQYQVQPIAHGDGDACRSEKVRQIKDIRQVRDNQAVEVCRGDSIPKLGMANRQGIARGKVHRKILDRLRYGAIVRSCVVVAVFPLLSVTVSRTV